MLVHIHTYTKRYVICLNENNTQEVVAVFSNGKDCLLYKRKSKKTLVCVVISYCFNLQMYEVHLPSPLSLFETLIMPDMDYPLIVVGIREK